MTIKLRVTYAATAALAALGLASCSPGDLLESAVESAVEKGIESATGAEFDMDTDSGSFSIETEDGSFSIGTGGDLPDGFPEDAVPLADGEIVQSTKVSEEDSDGYMVTMSVQGSLDDVFDKTDAQMKAAGYTEVGVTDMGEIRSVAYEGTAGVDNVAVSFISDGDNGIVQVSYIVTVQHS